LQVKTERDIAKNNNEYQIKVTKQRDREILFLMDFIRSMSREVEKVCKKTESQMKILQEYVDTCVKKFQSRINSFTI